MTGPERGFLLLCSHLGDPDRKPLTAAQFRTLSRRVRDAERPTADRELTARDLKPLGYGEEEASRIIRLLGEEERLDAYLRRAQTSGCRVLTRFTGLYPAELEAALGEDAPAVLWYRGDPELLRRPKIALVGSRALCPQNEGFARQAGLQAARQGFALVSGNARGADKTAQDACLAVGGCVISVLADELPGHTPAANQLLLCEDSFDLAFSAIRALSRNRIIHALGQATLIAQCGYEKGGTWDGTAKNLRYGWSPVSCFDDGSPGAQALEQMGARLIGLSQLQDLQQLFCGNENFLNM